MSERDDIALERMTRDELRQLVTEAVRQGVAAALAQRAGPDRADDAHLSQRELAKLWGVSERTIREWMATRGVPFMGAGRTVRFDRGEVDRWASQHKPVTRRPGAGARAAQGDGRIGGRPRPGPPAAADLTSAGRIGTLDSELSGRPAERGSS